MEPKTNPMRHLDRLGIPYEVRRYGSLPLSAMESAAATGEDPKRVFKTLVATAGGGSLYVFMVPADCTLDLKKAAASAGVKSLSMVPSADLLRLTGYVHGGCSPLCLKRPAPLTVDSSAKNFDRIFFSAGKIGFQMGVAVADLPKAADFVFADVGKPADGR